MSSNVTAVLDFWFGPYREEPEIAARQASLWWGKNAEVDRLIRAEFEGDLNTLVAGGNRDWLETPRGWLAAIIVLDQFSRNIYRDTPAAFAQDAAALKLCKDGLAAGIDRILRPLERVFFYLPLEHSESLELQVLCVELFTQLRNEVEVDQKPLFAGFLDYAEQHRVVIEQFGRYPHRNAILGRASTAREVEYLALPGSGF